MFVKQFLTGGDRNYGYLAVDESTKLAAIIDPSYSPKLIYDFSKDNGYSIEYIFVTHNHSDHTNGNDAIKKLSGVFSPAARRQRSDDRHHSVRRSKIPDGRSQYSDHSHTGTYE